MKRKIFNSLLLLTTFVAAMSVFVSCKDYDDDINDLRNQITTNATDLQSLLTERINNVNTEITNLQTQAANLQTAYDAADKQLQANIDALDAAVAIQIANASNDAEDYADAAAAAAEAAAKAYADVQAAEAQKAAIEAAQSLVDDAVAKLEVQLEAAIQDAAEGLASLQGYVDAQDASLQAQIDAAITAANDSNADLQNQIDAITAAIDAVSSELATKANSSDLDALKEKVEEYYNELIAADAKLEEGIATAQADANTANDLANKALTLAEGNAEDIATLYVLVDKNQTDLSGQISNISGKIETIEEAIAANETAIGNLEITVGGLSEIVEDLQGQISTIGTTASNALTQANENLASIKSLEAQLTSLEESNDKALAEIDASLKSLGQSTSTNAENIEKLELALTALQSTVEENQTAIEEMLAEEVEALKGEIAAAVIEAEAYANAVAAAAAEAAAEALEKAVGELTLSIAAVESAYQSADQDLQDNIDALSGQLDTVAKDLQAGIDALDIALSQHEADMNEALKAYATTSDLATLQTTLEELIGSTATDMLEQIVATYATIETTDGLREAIEAINKKIAAIGEGSFDELLKTIGADEEAIKALQAEVETINKNLGLALQRLKSLVFAPTTYVHGIECIHFATLSYVDWGDNLEADAASAEGATITVSDDSHFEEYLVNPSNVDPNSIASLSFISNEATDIATRAVSDDAPVAVADWELGTNEKGSYVMTVNITKTDSKSFGMDLDNFTIVALKAVISEKYMTEDEIAAGEEVAVYSDWARLYETSKTPYIHNAQAVDANDELLEDDEAAHFWAFSEIYGGGDKNSVRTADEVKVYIVDEYSYLEDLDLSDFSLVCDHEGNTYDIEKYGFSFEYNLITLNVGADNDYIDQSVYATIDGSVVTPQGSDGKAYSREAIGKTPVIQVVLRDDNNETVVDVRYFVIKWIDAEAVRNYGELDSADLEYECGGALLDETMGTYGYTLTVDEATTANLYDNDKWSMTSDEFYGSYELLSGVYASLEDAEAVADGVDNPTAGLGTLTENSDHSITWTIDYNDAMMKASQKDYDSEEHTMVVSGWGVYQSTTIEGNVIVFEVTMNLEIGKMEVIAYHNETMWTKESGARVVNPQIETDKVYGSTKNGGSYETTMILASLLQGYIYDGIVPGETLDLLNKGDEAHFVFDEDKLDEVANSIIAKLGDDYTEGAPGTVASLWYVDDTGTTLYYDGDPAAVITTDATGDVWIQLYESDNGSATSEPTEAAKLLVGVQVPVKLVDEWCGLIDEFEHFDVNFLTPLVFTHTTDTIELTDIYAGGYKSVSLDGTIEIKEDAINNHRTVWDNKVPSGTDAELVAWYGVEYPVYDMENAKTNLQKDGKIVGNTCNVLLSDIKNKDSSQMYRIEYLKDSNEFVFYNDSGSAISQEFLIEVQVTVKTKWQDAMVSSVYLKIKPGHGLSVKHQ